MTGNVVGMPATRRASIAGEPTVCFLVVATASAFAVAPLVELLFPVAAFFLACWLFRRTAYDKIIELALVLYLFAPFVRRIADWRSYYHPNSPILLGAPLVCLVGLAALLGRRDAKPWAATMFATAALTFVYATASGILLNGPVSAATEFAKWIPPIFGGIIVLLAPIDHEQYWMMLRRLAPPVLFFAGGYGIVQFFVLPPWDAAWMRDVSEVVYSIGAPEPLQVRVFSVASSPGPLAGTLSTFLLLVAVRRPLSKWQILCVVLGLTSLGLSQVRSAWIVFALGIVLLLTSRYVRLGRFLAVFVLVLLAAAVAGGSVADTVFSRVNQTTQAGSQDDSLRARTSFQSVQIPIALKDTVGAGFGSSGNAVRSAQGTGTEVDFANTDSGFLEELHIFGSVAGTLLLIISITTGVFGWLRSRRRPQRSFEAESVVLGALLLVTPVDLYFGPNVVDGGGLLFWVSVALLGSVTTVAPGGPRGERRVGVEGAECTCLI